MIKAIIFDLNGVFIKSRNLSDRFAEDFGVPSTDFVSALREIMREVRSPGAQECYSYWEPYLKKWGIDLNAQEFYDYWFGQEDLDFDLVALARKYRDSGIKIYLLSNNFKERSLYYLKNFNELMAIFEKIYFSWQTGNQKPEKEAFVQITNENELEPNECLYFDDSEINTRAASQFGFISNVYLDAKTTEQILIKYINSQTSGQLRQTSSNNQDQDETVSERE